MTEMDFSLFYFSSNPSQYSKNKYQLYIEGAKFADKNGLTAVWTPERHFHSFGGLYPNPAVLSASLAMVTERIRLRAGSLVFPLHHPIRIAENWSVVDNLSQGRVDIAFATGWKQDDFVFAPDNYEQRHEITLSGIETVRKLWRGESISFPNSSKTTPISIYPQPKQSDLNVWLTCSGSVERFIEAGKYGYNVLTALLFQTSEELEEKITAYRNSRRENGHDPDAGVVTLMLHTFVGESDAHVREVVKAPFMEYLKTSAKLWGEETFEQMSAKQQQQLLKFAFERYYRTAAMFGDISQCSEVVNNMHSMGVNEIACLMDFGIPNEEVMSSLSYLSQLSQNF